MNNNEKLQQSGHKYIGKLAKGVHILQEDGVYQVWGCNKYHASYGLIWRNTHLEFCRTASQAEVAKVMKA